MHRSTVTRAVREIRPLLAARGFAVPEGQRLKTMADVLAYAAAHGIILRMDGTKVQARRPQANRPGHRAFVSGKKKMNTEKATVFTGEAGRTVFAGVFRPGRMHDQTAVRTEGIADLLTRFPRVRLKGEQRHRQSSERTCVEHANADLKKWRPLQRYLGNRDDFDEPFQAIAGLVSDRAAR